MGIATTRRAIAAVPLLVFALLAAAPARAAPAPQSGGFWTIQGENDSISTLRGGSDRYYTSGLRLGWTSAPGLVPEVVGAHARALWGDGVTRIGFSLTQQIYTAADIRSIRPSPRDRPMAGYLAGTLSVQHDTEAARSVLAVTAGMIGPAALGRAVQNGFHELIRIPVNNGWGGQLPNEPQLQVVAERTWRVPLGQAGGIEADMLPSVAAGVGTVRDYAQGGMILRMGQGLGRDFGVARLRPGMTGGDVFALDDAVAWYVFGGVSGELVVRDAFLDGALWQNSAHVGRNALLASMEAGVAVIWRGVRLSYTQTWQTQSFRGQKAGLFNFGSLAATVYF